MAEEKPDLSLPDTIDPARMQALELALGDIQRLRQLAENQAREISDLKHMIKAVEFERDQYRNRVMQQNDEIINARAAETQALADRAAYEAVFEQVGRICVEFVPPARRLVQEKPNLTIDWRDAKGIGSGGTAGDPGEKPADQQDDGGTAGPGAASAADAIGSVSFAEDETAAPRTAGLEEDADEDERPTIKTYTPGPPKKPRHPAELRRDAARARDDEEQ